MTIKQEILDRMALDAAPGEASRLVTVSGSAHAGASTARRWAENHVPECAGVMYAEYAGRDDHGQQVYLVTYKLSDPGLA